MRRTTSQDLCYVVLCKDDDGQEQWFFEDLEGAMAEAEKLEGDDDQAEVFVCKVLRQDSNHDG